MTGACRLSVPISAQLTYSVPDVHCDACRTALQTQIGRVAGFDLV